VERHKGGGVKASSHFAKREDPEKILMGVREACGGGDQARSCFLIADKRRGKCREEGGLGSSACFSPGKKPFRKPRTKRVLAGKRRFPRRASGGPWREQILYRQRDEEVVRIFLQERAANLRECPRGLTGPSITSSNPDPRRKGRGFRVSLLPRAM